MTTSIGPAARRAPAGHLGRLDHVMVLQVVAALLAWFVVPVPLAIVVGRALRSGEGQEPRSRDTYDLAA